MPSPSTSLATQRPDIAESFMEFDVLADMAGYVSTKVFPVIEVAKQAGNYGKIPLEQLLKKRDTKRAPGSGYSRSQFTFDDAAYSCQEHGAEEVVDDREAEMYADYFDAEVVSGQRALGDVMRNAEDRVAAAVFNPTVWTGSALTTAITNEWDSNHTANATPIADVEAAVQAVYDGSGLWPNALIINQKVFRNLRNLDDIIERINSSGAGSPSKASDITTQMLAQVFALKHVIVAGGSENTANEGQAASIGQIWSDEYAMVCKVADTGDFREPCIGRTFHWGADGSTIGGTVESYREESLRGEVVRVRHDVDEIVLYPEAGHLLSNVTTI
jgi:hypothetical protein